MSAKPDASARFRELVDTYYRAWFRFHPEAAVDVGVPGYAHLLTPFAQDDRAALVCLNDQLVVGLEELGPAELTPDEALDYEILRGAAFLENQAILELEPRRPDPEALLPVNAIYQLTVRPVTNAPEALRARLRAVPDHLARAREYLRERAPLIPPLWLESAEAVAAQGARFVAGLSRQPGVALPDPGGLRAETDRAAEALADFGRFLRAELAPRAAGEFACGTPYFAHLLKHRHFLDVSAAELERFARELIEQVRRDLGDACRALGHANLGAAMARVRERRVAPEQLLGTYRSQMQAARAFLLAHDLVTLPARERLEVVETPIFLRHQIPFAAYMEPSPVDPEQKGYYYVTPPEGEEQLAEHEPAGIAHTCVHEAWPGHHLQFVTAHGRAASRSLARLLNASATLYEGWALYAEQLMHEQGFLSQPEQRVILLRDRLWRALRIVIDIGLHTRGWTLERAAETLTTHLGFPRSQAIADLTWYTRAPTVPLGYATGWALINALRDRRRAREGAAFSLKAFHDRLLGAGSIALPLVIAREFGVDDWRAVRGMLFGSPPG